MYRNLLIVGSDKCGKTTLASKIAKKENCNIVNLDLIVKVFETTFPKENDDNYDKVETEFITNYINEITNVKNLVDGKKVVLEGQIPNLEAVIKGIEQDRISIVGLTYDDINLKEFAHNIKEFASKVDTFHYLSEKIIEGKAEVFIEKSKIISKILDENDINYYDVSENRNEVLNQVVNDIDELTSYSRCFKVKKKK